MTHKAAAMAFPDPDRSLYDMESDEGATLYSNACIATELRREGFIVAKKQEGWISVEVPPSHDRQVLAEIQAPAAMYITAHYWGPGKGIGGWSIANVVQWMEIPPAALTPDPNG